MDEPTKLRHLRHILCSQRPLASLTRTFFYAPNTPWAKLPAFASLESAVGGKSAISGK